VTSDRPGILTAAVRSRSINPGDVVRINKRGRLFYALVRGVGPAGMTIEPLQRNVSHRQASVREVVDHWSHTVQTRREDRHSDAQTTLDLPDE
jgi:hypothetical protein